MSEADRNLAFKLGHWLAMPFCTVYMITLSGIGVGLNLGLKAENAAEASIPVSKLVTDFETDSLIEPAVDVGLWFGLSLADIVASVAFTHQTALSQPVVTAVIKGAMSGAAAVPMLIMGLYTVDVVVKQVKS